MERERQQSEVNRVVVGEIEHPQPQIQPQPFRLDDDFYEVEAIRRKRVRKGQLQYLIKWVGWPESANTWEPLENLQLVLDLVAAFEASLKSAKRQRRKRTHDNPPQSAPPSAANPHTVLFADEEDTIGDATNHANLED